MQPSFYEQRPCPCRLPSNTHRLTSSWTIIRLIPIIIIIPLLFLIIARIIPDTQSTRPSMTATAVRKGEPLRRGLFNGDGGYRSRRDASQPPISSPPTVTSPISPGPTEPASSTPTLPSSTFKPNSTNATVPAYTSSTSPSTLDNTTSTPSTPANITPAVITSLLAEPIQLQSLEPKENLLLNASHCVQFTEEQLVKELKQHGTYNPDFMAWDVRGVLNFFERASTDNYDKLLKKTQDRTMTVEQNLAAVEQLVKELNLQNCNLRTPDVLARLYNLSSSSSPTQLSPGASELDTSSTLGDYGRLRTKREETSDNNDQTSPELLAKAKYIYELITKNEASRDDSSDRTSRSTGHPGKTSSENEGVIGQVHLVPSGCRKRGSSEDGYLRLCSACQAIRRLPDSFFPPFLNEVTCDEDKACLYFYDYPHGKCRQKHLNLVVLKNVGTSECQLWKRYNINVRVSCECFVDEMSFFAKYV